MVVQNSLNRLKTTTIFFVPKDAQYSEMDFALNLTILRFLVFKLWSILYFTLIVHSGLGQIQKFLCGRGARPP